MAICGRASPAPFRIRHYDRYDMSVFLAHLAPIHGHHCQRRPEHRVQVALGLRRIIVAILILLQVAVAFPARAAVADPRSRLSRATVTLRRSWLRSITPNADSVPVYLASSARTRAALAACRAALSTQLKCAAPPIVYVLAGNNRFNCLASRRVKRATLYALSARTGALQWKRSTAGPGLCTTAGPVLDPSGQWLYAAGLDGKMHRYDAISGEETLQAPWPQPITLMPDAEKIAATPTLAGNHLYVTTSGFFDTGHFEGHLVTIDLSTGQATVFNTLCSDIPQLLGNDPSAANYCPRAFSGLFGRGQGVVDPLTHDVFIVSGNGAWDGTTLWGDTVLKLDPSGSTVLDSYTPTDEQWLDDQDLDLGSSGAAILPTLNGADRTYHLLVQAGKGPSCRTCHGAVLRLLNRDNLSGQGGPGHLGGDLQDVKSPGGCEVLTAPAVWKSPAGQVWVYYADGCGLTGYRVSINHGKPHIAASWSTQYLNGTPIMNHGTLFLGHGDVSAYHPETGQLLSVVTGAGPSHWEYPLVAGNQLFMTDEKGHVAAYAIARSPGATWSGEVYGHHRGQDSPLLRAVLHACLARIQASSAASPPRQKVHVIAHCIERAG